MIRVCVRARLRDDVEESWIARCSETAPWRIEVSNTRGQRYAAEGADLFVALQEVRKSLDSIGVRLCCNGARTNARPSPLAARQGSEFVYLVHRGRPATSRDVVPILGPAPVETIGTVDEQERAWRSLALSRTRSLWPINPAWWAAWLRVKVHGPQFWIPSVDADGFTTWARGAYRERTG